MGIRYSSVYENVLTPDILIMESDRRGGYMVICECTSYRDNLGNVRSCGRFKYPWMDV